jgi:hypothetical protein
MFYILVSRIPFVYNINDKKDKLFKTYLIGSICYIILHGFLHSKKFLGNSFVEKYRMYLLHLAGIDFVITSGIVFMLDNKLSSKTDVNSYVENADEDEDTGSIENEGKMTRDEILNNYYKNQMIAKQQAMQQNKSPFINKADAEELKKKDIEEKVSEKVSEKKEKLEKISERNSKSTSEEKEENIDELLDLITNTDIPVYKSSAL